MTVQQIDQTDLLDVTTEFSLLVLQPEQLYEFSLGWVVWSCPRCDMANHDPDGLETVCFGCGQVCTAGETPKDHGWAVFSDCTDCGIRIIPASVSELKPACPMCEE